MDRILSVPPFLIIGLVGLVYVLVLFARSSWREALLAAYITLLVSLLVLPGGKALHTRVGEIATTSDRALCFAQGTARGVPWRGEAALKTVDACALSGTEDVPQELNTPAAKALRGG